MRAHRATFTAVVMLASVAGADAPAAEPAAEALTLRDGSVVLGEVVESSPRGTVVHVRRDWARAHVPKWLERWERAEKATVARAVGQRRERLNAWRRDRSSPPALPAAQDRITPWLDRELDRLKAGAESTPSRLLRVRLGPGDVTRVVRRPKPSVGLLLEAWVSGLRDPEGLTHDELKGALEDRGFDPSRNDRPTLDALLPPQVETDAAWLVRRAATEVTHDPGLRVIRYQGLLLPDQGGEGVPDAMSALQVLPALGALLGDAPSDPLPAKLRGWAAWGRVGATLTELEIAPDLSEVRVRITLLVRQGGDRWAPAGARLARVRLDAMAPDAGRALADDPQIATVFKLVEAVGLKEISPEVKRRALNAGAAVAKALSQARGEAQADLEALALPVASAPRGGDRPAGQP